MPFELSVAIPAYNCARFLGKTLDSVLQAERASELAEIVIIDDGSTDDPSSVLKSRQDDRIRFVRQENQGACATFNACIRETSGTFLHILHGDDRILPRFYKTAINAMTDSTAGMFFSRCREIDVNGDFLHDSFHPFPEIAGWVSDLPSRIIPRNCIRTPGVLLRRQAYLDTGGYHAELSHTQDWNMWLKASSWGKTWQEPEPLAEYRIHTGSDTTAKAKSAAYFWETWRAIDAWTESLEMPEKLRFLDIIEKSLVRTAIADISSHEQPDKRVETIIAHFEQKLPHLTELLFDRYKRERCYRSSDPFLPLKYRRKILIFGAGEAGGAALRGLDLSRELPIAYLDNDTARQGQIIRGLPVFAPRDSLHLEFDHIILASAYHREMSAQLRDIGLDLRQTSVFQT